MNRNKLNYESFLPSKGEYIYLNKATNKFKKILSSHLRSKKINCEVFLGGSFAKETLIKSNFYEVDIFLRFKELSEKRINSLIKVLKEFCKKNKLKIEKLHGSRDYFRIFISDELVFEIVPVKKISSPKQAENSTDLSYAHVRYIKKEISKNKNLKKEIVAIKRFCKAQKVYGAESFVGGFSGYALECLIINYKSLIKVANSILNSKEKIILDPARHYKNKHEILISLNESKLQSPIVLIDPTWKERNVLAALSNETFEKFKESLKKFISHPSKEFFIEKSFDEKLFEEEAKLNNLNLIKIKIKTNKQNGDIAGTKLLKFSRFLEYNINKKFNIVRKEFVYNGEKEAVLYISARPMQEIIQKGPPVSLKIHSKKFKELHPNAKEINGVLYATLKTPQSLSRFFEEYIKDNKGQIRNMDIIEINKI